MKKAQQINELLSSSKIPFAQFSTISDNENKKQNEEKTKSTSMPANPETKLTTNSALTVD